MDNPLDGINEKLKRSHENIVNLESEIAAFLQAGEYSIVENEDLGLLREKVKHQASRPIPLRFSVLAGETIHHLRSCLDYVAWGLSSQQYRLSSPSSIEFP